MKVILLSDVENLGRTGDVREVSAGFARNYLLRKSLVVEASESQLKRIEALKVRRRKEDDRRHAEALSLAERISALSLRMPVRVGEGGRLFGTVTTVDVAAALKAQYGHEIDRRQIEIANPVRAIGPHEAVIRLEGQVQATLTLDVVEIGS